MYKLNSESRTAKFFTWIWGKKVTDYKTMCPYFWQYLLTIMFLPIILVGKFIYYLMPAKKAIDKARIYVANSKVGDVVGDVVERDIWYTIGKIIKWTYISACILFLGVLVIFLLYKFFTNIIEGLAVIGGVSLSALFIFMLVQTQDKYNWWRAMGTPFRFIGDMISNLYHEVCPLIKWE